MKKSLAKWVLVSGLFLAFCLAGPQARAETRMTVSFAVGGVGCGIGLFFYYASSLVPEHNLPRLAPAAFAWDGKHFRCAVPFLRMEPPRTTAPAKAPAWEVHLFRWEF